MARTYRILHRPWHARGPFYYLMAFELAGVVGLLVLFAISQTNPYRKEMWQIGFDHHWNSNPSMILYAYANHEKLPTVPFVWSTLCVASSSCSLLLLLLSFSLFLLTLPD